MEPVTGAFKLRTDKVWALGGTGFYKSEMAATRLEYQFQDKDSNFDEYSYREHRVVLRVVFAPVAIANGNSGGPLRRRTGLS